ncbi:MAG: FAD-dependent monooxygenase [Pseudomonadota bacterium]
MPIPLESHYDVIISGCGPCGASFANFLGLYEVSTLIIDREAEVLNIPRAVGMCDEGSRILESAGVFEHATIDLLAMSRTNFANVQHKVVFHYDMNKRINEQPMQRMFYQPQLERGIRNAFQRFSCIDFSPSTELRAFNDSHDGVIVELDQEGVTKTVRGRFLIACDGASSPVRKQLGIGFSGTTYEQDWLIIDVGKNPLESDEVCFLMDPQRPGVTMPLPLNKRRWEFVVKSDDNIEDLSSDSTIRDLLSHWGNFDDMQLERKAIYTFHARTAERFSKGNVFLAGDAAHITPPFAGQGMMAGLRDAQNLAWKLAGVIDGRLDQKILNSYSAERVEQCKQVIKMAQFIGNIVLPQNTVKVWLRNVFLKLLTVTGLYSEQKGFTVDKIPNHINGRLFRHFWINKTRGTGAWFPQFPLTQGKDTKPSDAWIDSSYHIISWGSDAELGETTRQRWRDLGGKLFALGSNTQSANNPTLLADISGEFEKFFGNKHCVVIRPDKMIVIKCTHAKLESKLNAYLDSVCSLAATGQEYRT